MSSSPQAEFAAIAAAEGRAAVVTVVGGAGAQVGAKILVRDDGSTSGSLGSTELDAVAGELGTSLMWAERSELHEHQGIQLFVDATAPAPRLVIFGAVDYTTALCRLARAAGWRPIVCDPRSQFATPERFPDAEAVIQAWPEEAFQRVGIDGATYVAVLTHDPKLDDSALGIALRSEAAYVGAMGSRRAQERRRERLTEQGLRRGRDGQARRPDRAGPRRHRARGDRALDHGRGGGRPERARGRPPAPQAARPHPRGWRSCAAGRAGCVAGGSVIAGLVLAAGAGQRFGATKQLADLDGRPLLEHGVAAMASAGLDRLIVVLGSRADDVLAGVDLHGAEPLVCERWGEGQAASLACGLSRLADTANGDLEAVVVALGDQPGLATAAVHRVLASRGDTPAVRATYGGEPGHPVVLERGLLPKLRDATGDLGVRGVLRRAGVTEVACDDLGGGADVNTPAELAALRSEGRPA